VEHKQLLLHGSQLLMIIYLVILIQIVMQQMKIMLGTI